jgi:hypothetical protein
MDRRWQLLLIPAIASSALIPTELKARSVGGDIGATSRASIGIALTVAPRMGLQAPNARLRGEEAGRTVPQSWCIWSSASLRSYTIMVQDQPRGYSLAWSADRDSGVVPLVAGTPFEAIARSSAAECDEPAGVGKIMVKTVSQGDSPANGNASQGSVLLILAPQ